MSTKVLCNNCRRQYHGQTPCHEQTPRPFFVLRGMRTEGGPGLYYTGRTGEGWISTDPKEAFVYQSRYVADRKAAMINKGTWIHRVAFTAEVQA